MNPINENVNNNIIISTILLTSNDIENLYGDKNELHELLTQWNMGDLLHYFVGKYILDLYA